MGAAVTYGPPCGIVGPVSNERMLSFADLQLPPLLKVWTRRYEDAHTRYAPPSKVIGMVVARALRQQQKPHPFPGKVPFVRFAPNGQGPDSDFAFFEYDMPGTYPNPAHVSALITRLAEDGIEPFITDILGAASETPWLASRDYESLKARILAAEEQYQEAATRWLVYDRMRQIAMGLREDVVGYSAAPRSPAVINAAWNGQLVEYMPLLCSLWGYMTCAIEADREPRYFPSDWRSVARTFGPIDLGGLS